MHIGEALFVRGPAGVSLTEVGRVVHCRAVKIIAEAKALTRDIGDGDDRQLHIGFSRYLDPGWSGELARQLKEARVCSAVSPSWAPSLDLLSLVRESSLDAAIIGAPPKVVREYELMEIGSYEHVIALSETPAPATGARLVAERPDRRAAAGTEGLAVSAYSQFMNDAMDAAAFAPRRSVRPNDLSILLAQVASGDGFAFLPLSLTKFAYPGWPSPLCRRRSTKASACRWGLAVSPTSRLRASETQFECFVETARRVAAG
ncbi:LysR family transcriptional regulator [Pseudomonas aeruginosa]|nr:LysR family transcriptional regulator [Pseudomonas aeruginosa]